MKFQKLLLSILAISAFALSTACSSSETVEKRGPERTNFLGIYTSESESYAPTSSCTFNVDANDLVNEPLPQGNRVTWFWGLITYTD